jgi:hypothetical protein
MANPKATADRPVQLAAVGADAELEPASPAERIKAATNAENRLWRMTPPLKWGDHLVSPLVSSIR